ncbi:hypothetical protein [Paenibacillus gansuensis]|uniref:Uncharacterized protein n=1 Tax=Paenibacillus gansuensis TaxID=306542 RepID=A0ABW5PE33_9BACL
MIGTARFICKAKLIKDENGVQTCIGLDSDRIFYFEGQQRDDKALVGYEGSVYFYQNNRTSIERFEATRIKGNFHAAM